MVLSGVIYLHDLSQDRLPGHAPLTLERSNGSVGLASNNVVLATTKWNRLSESEGLKRQAELKEVHWKPKVDKGSQVRPFMGDQESAWKVVSVVLKYKLSEFRGSGKKTDIVIPFATHLLYTRTSLIHIPALWAQRELVKAWYAKTSLPL